MARNPLSGLRSLSVAVDLIPITPNDDENLPTTARAIRCKPESGTGGTIRVTTRAGEVRNTDISPGEVLLLYVTRVHETGTTATGLEAMI